MRVAIPMRRRALWAALLALALIALLPLRLALMPFALDSYGLSARVVSGPVWSGRLTEARLRGAPLGDLNTGLAPLPLLLGRARLWVSGTTLSGAITVTPRGGGIDDFTGRIPLDGTLADVPVVALELGDASVRFADGACIAAEGRVRAEIARLPGVALGQGLAGTLRCQDGALLLPLTGQSGMERLELSVRGDGRWTARLALGAIDPAAAAMLERAGFGSGTGGLAIERSGRL